jgi:hypothetical protein
LLLALGVPPESPNFRENWPRRPSSGDEVITSIASYVSLAMLSPYSHVRMEAKRRAMDEIAARQCAADEKREADAERRERVAIAHESAVVQ